MVGPLLSGDDKRNGANRAKMAVTDNCRASSAPGHARGRASASPSLFHCKRWPSSGIDQVVCPASRRHPPIPSRPTRFAAVLSNQELVRPSDDTLNNSIREAAERFRRRRGPCRGWRKTYIKQACGVLVAFIVIVVTSQKFSTKRSRDRPFYLCQREKIGQIANCKLQIAPSTASITQSAQSTVPDSPSSSPPLAVASQA
ncbi:hypothetical protein B0T18DRAFT_139569 [Schizothecium vesticola]|uniref:Uncharacterized protein n=1 Tax=Schizothecium vesticola TaxID=314040 RepID=A0AA40K550_9PEZI|nr:hypothetical protein B0T18DRAFT_139569 [Schizothecium vesticola]